MNFAADVQLLPVAAAVVAVVTWQHEHLTAQTAAAEQLSDVREHYPVLLRRVHAAHKDLFDPKPNDHSPHAGEHLPYRADVAWDCHMDCGHMVVELVRIQVLRFELIAQRVHLDTEDVELVTAGNVEANVIVDSVVVGRQMVLAVAAEQVNHSHQDQPVDLQAAAEDHSSCLAARHKVVFVDPVVHKRACVGDN